SAPLRNPRAGRQRLRPAAPPKSTLRSSFRPSVSFLCPRQVSRRLKSSGPQAAPAAGRFLEQGERGPGVLLRRSKLGPEPASVNGFGNANSMTQHSFAHLKRQRPVVVIHRAPT